VNHNSPVLIILLLSRCRLQFEFRFILPLDIDINIDTTYSMVKIDEIILKMKQNIFSASPVCSWKNRIGKLSMVLLLALLSGCAGLSANLQLSSLAQQQRHHEIIKQVSGQKAPSAFQMFLLCGAYYEIRDYDSMLQSTKRLSQRIAAGDRWYYTIDLSVYPYLLRSYAYLDQGDYPAALREASQAYTMLHRPAEKSNGSYHTQLIGIMRVMGVAHAHLHHDAEADQCIATLQHLDTRVSELLAPEKFIAIATIHMARENYPAALSAIQHPEARVSGLITAFYDQTFQEVPRFFIYIKCLYETGRLSEAREGYDQLLKHPQIKQVGGIYWPVLLDRARIARADGQDRAAETLLREAVAVIERQRSSIRSEAGRIGYVGDKQTVYQELIDILTAENRPAEAFEFVERAKGRALVDLLASKKNIAVHTGDAGEIQSKLNELAVAEKKLGILGTSKAEQQSDQVRGLTVTLKKEISARAPEFASLVSVAAASASEIQERLAADEILIEYFASNREWFVFAVRRDSVTAIRLGALDLDQDVRRFRAALTRPTSDDYKTLAVDLYRKIIGPVAGRLTSPRWTIVPHGPLHYLPFGALSSGDNYLVDRANIRVLQTAGILKFLKSRKREDRPKILVLGNPDLGDSKYDLKYAQEEAQAISAMMPGATLLLRDAAKASFIRQHAGQYDMIHFAAHAVFDPENPLDSALLLAGGDAGDGWLRAGELYRLRLNAELVTLSACETALGQITKGDDVVGFTRGLLYAGSGSIVSTLWQVDDRATKDLMLAFYRNLLTMEHGEALRQAQIHTKNKYAHPFYWASFQLTGNMK
jgi:CHAT domain-containing protein